METSINSVLRYRVKLILINMRSNLPNQEMTIGQLAGAAGVNVETIRYYQRIKLITEPKKPLQGYRKYTRVILEQILFIKRAQQLGFNLQEIADLLELGDGYCNDVRIQAEKKLNKIEKQIKDLLTLQTSLNQLINSCYSGKSNQKCPIVQTLLNSDK